MLLACLTGTGQQPISVLYLEKTLPPVPSFPQLPIVFYVGLMLHGFFCVQTSMAVDVFK